MDHSPHSNHGGMDMPQCTMHMLWNSQVAGTCIVFPAWHIRTPLGMLLSCLAIVAISIVYARLLWFIRAVDWAAPAVSYTAIPSEAGYGNGGRRSLPNLGGSRDHSPVGSPVRRDGFAQGPVRLGRRTRVVRAALYALTVAISFFLMLVAMTYNTYLFGAIIIGSFIGHYMYESDLDPSSGTVQKGLACH